MNDVVLFDYWRSSASYRVRIALNLAEIEYQAVSVDLLQGDHRSEQHLSRNPQGFVPVLDIDGHSLTQSLAILTYLDSTRNLELLPVDPADRAKVEAAAHAIAVDIHPVCNVSVARHAASLVPNDDGAMKAWMQRFIRPGLVAAEALLSDVPRTDFAFSTTPGLFDICLMPQLYNADRWGVDTSDLPCLTAIAHHCAAHPAFVAAHPDAVKPA